MNARLIFSALSAAIVLAGCAAQQREYAWIRGGSSATDRKVALEAAHAEAMKAYPSTAKLKNPSKDPRKAEKQLGEMRESVEELYLSAHGWHHVYTRDGRVYPAERE